MFLFKYYAILKTTRPQDHKTTRQRDNETTRPLNYNFKKILVDLLACSLVVFIFLSLQYERQEIHSASQWRYRHGFLGFVIYLVDTSLQISESYHYDFLPSYHIERFLGNDIISRKDAESRLKVAESQSRRV